MSFDVYIQDTEKAEHLKNIVQYPTLHMLHLSLSTSVHIILTERMRVGVEIE